MERQLIWSDWSGTLWQHVRVEREGRSVTVDGVLLGLDRSGAPLRVRYAMVCDDGWRARQFSAECGGEVPLRLRSDSQGNWRDGLDEPLSDFEGCVDLLLLDAPICWGIVAGRLSEAVTTRSDLSMLAVSFPKLHELTRKEVRFSRVAANRFLYEGDGMKATEMEMDADGMPFDLPGLARRIYPGAQFPLTDREWRAPRVSRIDDGDSPVPPLEDTATFPSDRFAKTRS